MHPRPGMYQTAGGSPVMYGVAPCRTAGAPQGLSDHRGACNFPRAPDRTGMTKQHNRAASPMHPAEFAQAPRRSVFPNSISKYERLTSRNTILCTLCQSVSSRAIGVNQPVASRRSSFGEFPGYGTWTTVCPSNNPKYETPIVETTSQRLEP